MDDAGGVGGGEGVGERDGNAQHLAEGQPLPVGVAEGGHGARFLLETGAADGVRELLSRKDLDRDLTAEAGVASPVDLTPRSRGATAPRTARAESLGKRHGSLGRDGFRVEFRPGADAPLRTGKMTDKWDIRPGRRAKERLGARTRTQAPRSVLAGVVRGQGGAEASRRRAPVRGEDRDRPGTAGSLAPHAREKGVASRARVTGPREILAFRDAGSVWGAFCAILSGDGPARSPTVEVNPCGRLPAS